VSAARISNPPRARDGVDWTQVRALLVAGIKLDLRSSRQRPGATRRVPPLVAALITYGAMGTLLASALATRGDTFIYSLFTISAAMFLTALTVIMEYSTVVVHPDDFEIMAHRPVSPATYFWAKVGNLLFYVTLTALALSVAPTIIGSLALGGGPRFGAVYLPVAVVACGWIAAVAVLFYTAALRAFGHQRLTSWITYFHTVATVVLVLGYIFLPRALESDPTALTVQRGWWIFVVPPAWFAGAVELAASGTVAGNASLALLALASTVAVGVGAANTISLDYSRQLAELASAAAPARREEPRTTGRRGISRIGTALCRTDVERAGFELMARYMRRDKRLRSRIYPAFGLPLAAYLYGLLSRGPMSPFAPSDPDSPVAARELLGFYSVFMTFFFAATMTQSEEWQASWIFYAAPIESRAGLLIGARKLVIGRFIVPFFVALGLLLLFVMPPGDALVLTLMLVLLTLLAFSLLSLAAPHPPLSQAPEKTRNARQIGLVMILGMFMAALVAVQRVISIAPRGAWTLIAVLAGLAALADAVLRRRLRKRLASEDFDG
jgi:ABC-2 type transport system permease protein